MRKVLMHGPGIRNPEEMQEREIVLQDVQAYVAVGWKKGGLPKEVTEEVVKEVEEEAKPEKPVARKKATKAKG